MKQQCQACGVEKDSLIREIYPYPEDGIIEDPIEPLMSIDCQGPVVEGVTDWRVATVCHACFHKLAADMWTNDRSWSALMPVVPFVHLPHLSTKK